MNGNSKDSLNLNELVRLVIQDLERSEQNRSEQKPINEVRGPVNHPKQEPSIESVPAAKLQMSTEIVLSEKLITQAIIIAKDDGKTKQWKILPKSILTPLGRDELRKRGITLISSRSRESEQTVHTSDEKSKAVSSVRSIIIGLHDIENEKLILPLLERLGKTVSLTIFREKCIKETAKMFRTKLESSEGQAGIMLTNYASLGAMLANRQGTIIRALTGITPEQVRQEAPFMGANLLVLDPKVTGFYRIQQIVSFFIEKGPFEQPKFLRES